ncbi:MAG: DUF1223 domain-containing protein [Hyphomicrobiales bacterium]|nr:DUF1223 domain-containing protein [Hyphomicrobiales bacterium]MCY4039378.1 DUF1223 domain-containing protein [Hyphomicrobiales bacterium]
MKTLQKLLLGLSIGIIMVVGARGSSADVRPVLVELFTSQGCSSCPPADEFAVRLSAETEDVLLISLPVDYWDYLGWKDTLASPAFTNRQRSYASVQGKTRVYTPQMVVDGQVDTVGSRENVVRRIIERRREALASGSGAGADLRVSRESDGSVQAHVSSGLTGADSATLWLVRLRGQVPVDIGRGENRGHTITYANVAREMVPLGRWYGGGWTVSVPLEGGEASDGIALILQADEGNRRGIGPVLGTVWVKHPSPTES